MQSENRVGLRIQQLRDLLNVSVSDLAERTGLEEDVIAHIEGGSLIPSLTPLVKIARALGVRLGTFLDDEEQTAPVITRANEAPDVVHFSGNGLGSLQSTLDFFSLARNKKDRHMEPFLIEVHPAATREFPLSSHEGEEFLYVLSGEIEVAYGKDVHRVGAGDSAYYDSIVPHHVHAAGDEAAKILAVVYTPV
ncbi:MAG: cupin domain-containing protein [Armatimonadia bacterium]